MENAGRYRQIDHTGDIGIDAEAPDEASLFAVCARALFDILAGEDAPIEGRESLRIRVEAPDRQRLLVGWLRELLYLHETEGWLFRGFSPRIQSAADGSITLLGTASGERIDPARHRIEREVKAVTYHQIAAERGPEGRWTARVIFDI
ncbi:MAG TPA: archease [Candidatus Saccharimonadales bacterium]|nr:archease [Candidatus Saccharimonadales bacterium]